MRNHIPILSSLGSMIKNQPIHRGIARQILLAEAGREKLRIPHRGEVVSREHTSNVLQQGAEGRRRGGGEHGACPACGIERHRLVLGGDGGQHGRLASADGAAAELDAHDDIGEHGEVRGRDGEGHDERDAEMTRTVAATPTEKVSLSASKPNDPTGRAGTGTARRHGGGWWAIGSRPRRRGWAASG
jgi:hypothetical protein